VIAACSLSASLEDYLEAIFHIVSAKQAARAKDVSDRLGVNRSSVTAALQLLAERGLVNYAPYDIITLTDSGQAAAGKVVRRHEVLRDFFVKVLGVSEQEAGQTACRMEHVVSGIVLCRLERLGEFVAQRSEHRRQAWLEEFLAFCCPREAVIPDMAPPPASAAKEDNEYLTDRRNHVGSPRQGVAAAEPAQAGAEGGRAQV
jgi:DtxR family Mn-dependent transcriptional regulator